MTPVKVFADECCAKSLVTALRNSGLNVSWAVEDGPGMSDREQARRAFQDKRIVLSADYDFGELAARRIEAFVGLVRAVCHILIIEPDRVRQRPL